GSVPIEAAAEYFPADSEDHDFFCVFLCGDVVEVNGPINKMLMDQVGPRENNERF
ncbi:hypothetical protein Taro_050013, partial [Colocasia esculenta]|nr:hypothetical protein [Colocasia esculenta]